MPAPRYRQEDGRTCIDVRVKSVKNLFDLRDPAPFRERDLDDDAAEYIVDAADEIGTKAQLRVVIFVAEAPPPDLTADEIARSVTAHFAWERERCLRRLREHFRRAQFALVIGLFVLVTFLALAQLTPMLATRPFQDILREGLVIIGWVAMWRPVELLLYDWWPLESERRLRERLVAAEVVVRAGESGGDATAGRR
jgi:hypothetical protein